jgi:hypothetical protein
VQTFLLPPGVTTLNLMINEDPEIARGLQRDIKVREREKAEQERMKLLEEGKYKTETGNQPIAG